MSAFSPPPFFFYYFFFKQHGVDLTSDSLRPDHIPVRVSMEAKGKTGASAPKAASKAEKKEPAAPRKADPAPAPAPATPEPEQPPPQDGAAEAEAAAEGEEAAAGSTDSLEQLKPFLIGGAIIAAGAILLGALLLARRN